MITWPIWGWSYPIYREQGESDPDPRARSLSTVFSIFGRLLMETKRQGPLEDLTIIDCTRALAGPFGAGLLADMGAWVIKVEPPSGMVTATFRRFAGSCKPHEEQDVKRTLVPRLQ